MEERPAHLTKSPIDYDSQIPYYIQIKEKLKQQIKNGSLKNGDLLPGESTLCQYFSVSRTVVRQALTELDQEGLVIRKRGRGTFISEPETIEKLTGNLIGFYHEMKFRGHNPYSQIINQEIIIADQAIARNLSILPGDKVIRLKRLRLIENDPIVLTDTYLPYRLVPGLEKIELSKVSLYDVLEKEFGLIVKRGHRIIGATVADSTQAKLFQTNAGQPLIVINNITYLEDDTPVEYYYGLYRGDRNIFEVEMIRQQK
ncbi:MAG: GntR family transcriptional regulator [Anaerolineaceae bacterium]